MIVYLFHYFQNGKYIECIFLNEDGNKIRKQYELSHYFYAKSAKVADEILAKHPNWTCETVVLKNLSEDRMQRYFKITAPTNVYEISKEYGDAVSEADISSLTHFVLDHEFLVNKWYELKDSGIPRLIPTKTDMCPPLSYLTVDIETSHHEHCFPNSTVDPIISIAAFYIKGTSQYLWVGLNDIFFGKGVENFEFDPYNWGKVECQIEYCKNEGELIQSFINLITMCDPHVLFTYNGDEFDIKYILDRCVLCQVPSEQLNHQHDYRLFKNWVHIDVMRWVERDSMLPLGKRGLKTVAQIKLNAVDPIVVDHDKMAQLAIDDPKTVIMYNASDVLLTDRLGRSFACLFNLTLGNEIPKPSDIISRSGTGSLVESAFMYIYFKNKYKIEDKAVEKQTHLFKDWPAKTETYAGGSVSCSVVGIQCGKFPETFDIDTEFILKNIEPRLEEFVHNELDREGFKLKNIVNLDDKIKELKNIFKTLPSRVTTTWKTLHIDVKAMYPNAMRNEKIQPHAIKFEKHCEYCRPESWIWKGTVWNMTKEEYEKIASQAVNKKNIELACDKFVRDMKRKPLYIEKESVENVFMCQQAEEVMYQIITTFTLKREEKKLLKKQAQQAAVAATDKEEVARLLKLAEYYDAVQLSFKTLLNSIYGALKMRGNRLGKSAEIAAGIITYVCRCIILFAVEMSNKFSKPLEHDTDGAWCKLPDCIPFHVEFKDNNGKKIVLNVVNLIINGLTREKFLNTQFIKNGKCVPTTFMEFEPDPPYGGMFFPSGADDSTVKKKYILISDDYSKIKDVKGIDRKGEINFYYKLQNIINSTIPKAVQNANTILEFYKTMDESIADYLKIIKTRGKDLSDEEFFYLFSETRRTTKELSGYKAITPPTACIKRLLELTKDDTLKTRSKIEVNYFISKYPISEKRKSDRVIPTIVFQHDEKEKFLKMWTKQTKFTRPCDLADWDHLEDRIYPTISRFIYNPRKVQCGVVNPLVKVRKCLPSNQPSIDSFFKKRANDATEQVSRKIPALGI